MKILGIKKFCAMIAGFPQKQIFRGLNFFFIKNQKIIIRSSTIIAIPEVY